MKRLKLTDNSVMFDTFEPLKAGLLLISVSSCQVFELLSEPVR